MEDQGDRFVHLPDRSLDYALAASVHMDLTLEGLVDTDRDHLVLMDYTAMGYDLPDPILADIASSGDHKADYWVERTTDHARDIREEVLARRVARKTDDKRGGGIARYSGSTGLPGSGTSPDVPLHRVGAPAGSQGQDHGRTVGWRNP